MLHEIDLTASGESHVPNQSPKRLAGFQDNSFSELITPNYSPFPTLLLHILGERNADA